MNGTTNRLAEINKRFQRETAEHEMTVLHDDGLYRHLRFTPVPKPGKPRHSFYWFDLITVPGALIFQGDGESFTFRRVEDMFEFFRGPVGRINPHYWSEKLTSSGRDQVMKYDEELFAARVKEAFVDAARGEGVPAGTGKALREDVLDQDLYLEHDARQLLDDFEHKGFRFYDTWEWSFQDYDWWFLWALHGIVWGIAQYDAAKTGVQTAPAVVDVHLPEAACGAVRDETGIRCIKRPGHTGHHKGTSTDEHGEPMFSRWSNNKTTPTSTLTGQPCTGHAADKRCIECATDTEIRAAIPQPAAAVYVHQEADGV